MKAVSSAFPAVGLYDVLLVIVVTLQTTALAYLYNPRWKALVYGIPFPYTLASLAVGRPMNASNVLAVLLLLVYSHTVRILHTRLNVPISLSIIAGLLLDGVIGMLLAPHIPQTNFMFWASVALVIALGLLILGIMPPREEPGHKTPLAPAIKITMTFFVVIGLVLLKGQLQGFTTAFPMVGVLGAYESRHSLWTMSRQISILILTVTPMIVTVWLVQGAWGLPLALAVSWIVFGAAMLAWLKFGRRLDHAWHAVETV